MSDVSGWPDDSVHLGVGRLLAAYSDVVTRYAWGELDDLFLADAPVTIDTGRGEVLRLIGASAVGEFIAGALERFEFFEMVPLNFVVQRDGDGIGGRCYIHEIRQHGETRERSDAYGLYEDRYATGDDGRWRFAARRYRSLAHGGEHLDLISGAGG